MTLTELQRRADTITGHHEALLSRKKEIESEVAGVKKENDILTKTGSVLKHLLDTMVKEEISNMAGLITYGLKAIFEDQNLTFCPVISKKNERLNIELKTENDGIEGEFGSYGGSVAVIESFLLRVLCVLKMKLARFLLLDETFAAVGEAYIENTSRLVTEISKKLGLDVLLVTHQKEFQQHADHVYKVKESPKGLLVEKIK